MRATGDDAPHRDAGALPPFEVGEPHLQAIREVVLGARAAFGIDEPEEHVHHASDPLDRLRLAAA